MTKKAEKMNTRRWKLYNYIKENGVVNTKDICRDLPEYYTLATSDRVHNPCVLVNEDVDALNASAEIEKIIIHDRNYNFWLARFSEEALEYAEHLYKKRALTALKKYWNVVRKCNADGQGKLLSAQGNPIDEHSRARSFVEAFVTTALKEEDDVQ